MQNYDSIGILIVGHGSRVQSSQQEFELFVEKYRKSRPQLEIRHAFIELAKPDVKTELVEFCASRSVIVILPFFLFPSGHIKNDIPLIIHDIKREFPHHKFLLAKTIGTEPKLVQMMFDRMNEKLGLLDFNQRKIGAIVVGRGSSDVDSNGEFYKVVRFFEEGGKFNFVLPTFIGITRPLIQDGLLVASRYRPDHLLIFPYFIFSGRLMLKIEKIIEDFSKSYPWIKVDLISYLSPGELFFSVLDARIDDALTEKGGLPCITCEYRQQMPGLPSKVGGMKALLWGLRHLHTHSQASPHEYPHKNLKKHILVCENVDCAKKGSLVLITRMRGIIKELGKQADFRITRTSCMGRCGEGPVVVIYPDGVWYQKVQSTDAEIMIQEHLLNDRIIPQLVDNIMQ